MNTEELCEKCMKCKKSISRDEYIDNGGLCINCMNEIEQEENEEQRTYISHNKVSSIVKGLSIIIAIIGIIMGLISIDTLEIMSFVIIISSIISAIFIYAIGEIISLLQEISNNTKK